MTTAIITVAQRLQGLIMRNRTLSLGIAALTLAAISAAYADGHVNVAIDPFGWWGQPPPVVYSPPRYYAPPTVYYGRGHWGGYRDSRQHYDRSRTEHHDRDDNRRR
jgi:hypothetical protein